LPEISFKNYIGKSAKYYSHNNILKLVKFHLFHFREMLLGRPYYSHKLFIKSFENIKFLITFFHTDYKNIVNYSNARFTLKTFSYLSFEQFFEETYLSRKVDSKDSGLKIMVNHNGDPMLNHFDALERLKLIECKSKIVIPLAYGEKKYIMDLKKYCYTNFDSDKFEFWDKFISPKDYSKRLTDIDVAIFNFSVQKGVGNILPLLWNGCKVFLREESPIYIDFLKSGFCVFSIQRDLTDEFLNKPLTDEEKNINKKLLNQLFSNNAVDNYYKNCFLLES
jgi:hypothetical protein